MTHFTSRRFIPRLVEKYGVLTDEKQSILNDVDLQYGPCSPDDAEFLYRLVTHCDVLSEIESNFKIRMSGEKVYKDQSLEWCQYLYGTVVGERKYNERCQANSARMKKYGGEFVNNPDIQDLAKAGQKKARGTDPLYDKKRNVFCVEYYHSRGIFDPFEIETSMNTQRVKSALTKENFIRKFGQDHWDWKNEKTVTALRNSPQRASSKEAMRYLRSVVESFDIDVLEDEIWWFDHPRGEWWIHDADNERRYFLDLCIPMHKIAVEYHGRYFHPKVEDDTVYESNRWGSMPDSKTKFLYDNQKRDFIIKKGYTLFEVWSDSPQDPDFLAKEICNAIRFRESQTIPTI